VANVETFSIRKINQTVGRRALAVWQVQGTCFAGGNRNCKVDQYLEAEGEEVVEEDRWLMGCSLACRAAKARLAGRRRSDEVGQ
jgi:hypothetical protein